MSIEVTSVSKTFGRYRALRDVTLTVPPGELVALLGPSGCGKTTLLRVIAGLERPDPGSGPIRFYDEDVARQNVRDRHVGFVFQHYSLFRHMTIFDNVAFGLKVKPRGVRPSDKEIEKKVMSLLRLVQLDGIAYRYPAQLSGGQRQRVALARALAVEPRVLLLDEPFGALDATVRVELRRWLRRLHDEIRLTSVFVTHDQEEALEVADRVVIMNEGRIEQIGTPDEVFHNPKTPFVMKFIGTVNSFHGRWDGNRAWLGERAVETSAEAGSDEVQIFVRPHEFDLDLEPRSEQSITATVDRVHSAGPVVRLELLDPTGRRLFVSVPQEAFASMNIAKGSVVHVTPRDLRVFRETTPV